MLIRAAQGTGRSTTISPFSADAVRLFWVGLRLRFARFEAWAKLSSQSRVYMV
jgi:hypothetical protein